MLWPKPNPTATALHLASEVDEYLPPKHTVASYLIKTQTMLYIRSGAMQ